MTLSKGTHRQESSRVEHRAGSPRRLKLLFVVDNLGIGGTELNAVRAAEHLDRERFDLRVVCLGRTGPLAERYEALGVRVEPLGLRSFYGPTMLSCGWRFVRMLRRERIDVVHAHDIYSNIFTAAWARVAGCRVVIASCRSRYDSVNRVMKAANRVAYRGATAVLANSTQVAKWLLDTTSVQQSRVYTITNFVDDVAFGVASAKEVGELRRAWGAPINAVVIGCVARLQPVKDHVTLVRAFERVRRQHPNTFLVLIGDGDRRTILESLCRELDLGEHVHFAGEIRSKQNLHRGFDISVLASVSEGFPNTLVEAMAAGRPVVSTEVGGCVDAVRDGETGFLVPAQDPAAMAEAIGRFVDNEHLRTVMGTNGLHNAVRSYGSKRVMEQLDILYSECATEIDH